MTKDKTKHNCSNCSAFGKHCPHKVNGDPYYYDCGMTVEELEKENAELKEKVNILDNCDRLGDMITEAYKEQLTKAKKIIGEFVDWANWQGNSKCPSFKSIQDKAEQFLKEE